ncbi:DDE superfamily endonuclease [Phytophthora infestans]|uniref:DDE superfamily endonuclease n=1 Tax=Phytophthora infestans TaxID=4787 RepID=A0A8S9U6N6_PHYIN|nr:DDE superfamily endonuclease [Phytophthora infestans]
MHREKEFRQSVRVDPATFDYLISFIVDDPIFYNGSENPQTDIAIQLAVTLEWCGTFKNGNTCGRLARSYGFGAGTISEFVQRARKSLLRFYSRFVAWPSTTKRTTSSAFHSTRYGLSGAIGFVDGTYVNISQKPHVDGHLFFTRKKRYGLNVQIFCDEDQRILHAHTGWPGSCGDALVFSHTQVSKNSERYFAIGEYLIGDSGYALSERLITPYKMPRAAQSDNARFNTIVSSARVVNENCIGALKNRWASLYGARTQIKVAEDFAKVNNHILLCVLLHNVTLQMKDPWTEEDREDVSAAEGESDDEDDDGCCIDTPPASRNAENKREMIKRRVLGNY